MTTPINVTRRAAVLGGLMVATSIGATLAMPKPQITSKSQLPDLEGMIPESFSGWKIDRSIIPLAVSPDVAQMLGTLYDSTISRTYVNAIGERVMLSIAYGANQSRALQLHKPEVCYSAQGFRLSGVEKSEWQLPGMVIPTMHLVGVLGSRIEPVTYWMRIGDEIARGWFEQNKVRIKYGIGGTIPDGVLFRISNISPNPKAAYELQRQFVQQLVEVMSPEARNMFIGAATLKGAG